MHRLDAEKLQGRELPGPAADRRPRLREHARRRRAAVGVRPAGERRPALQRDRARRRSQRGRRPLRGRRRDALVRLRPR